MKSTRTIALALGVSLAAGAAFAGSALAEDGRDQRQWRGDDDKDKHGCGDDHDDDNGRWDRDDRDDDSGRWDRDDRDDRDDGWRHDGGGDRWRNQLVSVRVYNQRERWVTLYLNGQYLGRVGPNSRERISLPQGYHTLTYQVGWGGRHGYETATVSAFHGQRNRLVIEGRRGWGRHWGH